MITFDNNYLTNLNIDNKFVNKLAIQTPNNLEENSEEVYPIYEEENVLPNDLFLYKDNHIQESQKIQINGREILINGINDGGITATFRSKNIFEEENFCIRYYKNGWEDPASTVQYLSSVVPITFSLIDINKTKKVEFQIVPVGTMGLSANATGIAHIKYSTLTQPENIIEYPSTDNGEGISVGTSYANFRLWIDTDNHIKLYFDHIWLHIGSQYVSGNNYTIDFGEYNYGNGENPLYIQIYAPYNTPSSTGSQNLNTYRKIIIDYSQEDGGSYNKYVEGYKKMDISDIN